MKRYILVLWVFLLCLQALPAALGSNVDAQVGDYIRFGTYEQHRTRSDGPEPIDWLVLDKQDDRLLIISKYALDAQPYNEGGESCTWESCTLRRWLNSEFIDTAFTAEEKALILPCEVQPDPNPKYASDPGAAVIDRVFLLSTDEAERYLPVPKTRMCTPTPVAITNGVYRNKDYAVSDGACCWWWYRTPGSDSMHAAYSYYNGEIVFFGDPVSLEIDAVRPVLWLKYA